MKSCFIFDLDGTLANGDHRLHHIKKETKDWNAYFEACIADEPIPHMIKIFRELTYRTEVFIVSGRSDQVRVATEIWLYRENVFLLPSHILMRKYGDHRPDDVIKIEMLAEIRALGFEPLAAFDDRDRVVAAWRAAGIPCLQVAPGDF